MRHDHHTATGYRPGKPDDAGPGRAHDRTGVRAKVDAEMTRSVPGGRRCEAAQDLQRLR
jgi:hypothetical protein